MFHSLLLNVCCRSMVWRTTNQLMRVPGVDVSGTVVNYRNLRKFEEACDISHVPRMTVRIYSFNDLVWTPKNKKTTNA